MTLKWRSFGDLNIYQNRHHWWKPNCICTCFHRCWPWALQHRSSRVLPVWILTRCSLEVNWSLTVKTWPLSISLDLGSFVRTLCVGFPQARDCSARTSSLSGISVSCWISCHERKSTAMPFNPMYRLINTYYEWRPVQLMPILEPVPLLNCLYV